MANIKISQLTAAASTVGTQEFEVNESGTSKKVTGTQIKTFVKDGLAPSDLTGVTATAAELNYTSGVTSAIQTQLGTKAPLASPALIGTPTAPTASVGTNTTQLATTEFVLANKTISGNQTFTASGSITAGRPVAINTDGTVSHIALSTGALLSSVTMPTTQASNTITENWSVGKTPGCVPNGNTSGTVSISDSVFVSSFTEGNNGPVKSRLVTISEGVMSTGTAFSTGLTNTTNDTTTCIRVTSSKFAVFVLGATSGTMVIGEVSGSTITFGSPVSVWSGVGSYINFALADGNGGILLAQNTTATNSPLRVAAISVTGTTPSVGAFTTLRSTAPAYVIPTLAYDPVNNVFLLSAYQQTTPWSIWSWGITISGTTVTVGSQTNAFGAEYANADYPTVIYSSSAGRFVALTPYVSTTISRLYTATVSASRVISVSAQTTDFTPVYNSSLKTTPDGTVLLGSSNDTSASIVTFDAGNSYKPIITPRSNPLVSGSFWLSEAIGSSGFYANNTATGNQGLTYRGYGFSNVSKLIGIATTSASTGQLVEVAVNGGLSKGSSGLTVSSQYYTNGAGGISTASSAQALGFAVSSTEILLQ